MSIEERIEQIQSRADFIDFVYVLRDEAEKSPPYWQNPDLFTYLDALANFTEEKLDHRVELRGGGLSPEPSWRLFAEILFAAAMWE